MFPVATIAQMMALERQAVRSGVTEPQMMDRAGHALCAQLLAYAAAHGAARGPVVVLAGPGHNGGDGLIAARYLHDAGERVSVYLWRRDVEGDALAADLRQRRVPLVLARDDADRIVLRRWLRLAAWCIDALLGTGSNRPIAGALAHILATVDSQRQGLLRVCAADCPSGVHCDTGDLDPLTLSADLTVMFGAAKRGLFRPHAFPACGVMVVGDIGLSRTQMADLPVQALQPEDLPALLPPRSDLGHKGTFGKVLCIGGCTRYPGAVVFSVLAAARTGAGLVTSAVPSCIQTGLIAAAPDATFLPLAHRDGALAPAALEALGREWAAYDAVLLGCGLSCTQATIAFVGEFLRAYRDHDTMRNVPLVLDADALNCLTQWENWPALLPASAVLTPHVAEMGRLSGRDARPLLDGEWERVARYAADWNCTLVLKGYRTLIGTPAGKVYVLHQPNSALATAGTGDVLSGLAAGFLAQGLSPSRAARAASLVHSAAGRACADVMGPASTLASDVLAHVPRAIQQAYAQGRPWAESREQENEHD